jgi:UDP-N-acetylglucosamine 2-epimerase (non-hydrolysing)
MKITIVLGTRPEIIKMSPLIRLFERKNIEYFVIHSNQHYSKNMDNIFFEELHLPQPKYNLGIGSAEHGNQTGRMLMKIEEILLKERPTVVLSQGDTNTVLAGILAAAKQNIPTGHVEAGLRSYDRRMPEEKNRIICDVLSDFLFAPTKTQENILQNEGIPNEKIFVVGNTIVDAVLQHTQIAQKKSTILQHLKLISKEFVLLTAHRALNVDSKQALQRLVTLIDSIPKLTGHPVIYPIHPRTKAKLEQYNLQIHNAIITEPLGYTDFLNLEMNASLIITDSGGIQEEACILHTPCITIRENTERPETVEVGANILVGLSIEKLKKAIDYHTSHPTEWKNPFGSGNTADKILEVLTSHL